ncbi:PEP/pyruvate-binding domain-containing protein [Candidatus Desulfovibrio trichonymphae]|uniref:Phosphoenolpyruvate synthase n=1 Tax=Candidatus Desulfovibrio trichonymphae TaxID=1725232 RepID=A0A1J1E371_9BACT|nr:PEP/pyruvate-binding domain-containing protein [Candidatus Desulfovibrio trichonymphae]BAV91880.1 phosphoenolpyruvate synthase [Candidatus Desulfovibrio trichonymphae]GHU98923.1 phosphoenolpyruvate synthase [Deltaproteobacteria bacterium]
MSKKAAANPAQAKAKNNVSEDVQTKLVLTGADIVNLGPEAELLVGGKNYNTTLISQIEGIQAPHFRALSSLAFHRLLDETKVNGRVVRSTVDKEYSRIDWNDPEINQDSDFLQKFVRQMGKQSRDAAKADGDQPHTKLRTFINNIVDGFATSPEGIDQLRKRSVIVQAAVLSVELPKVVGEAVREAYKAICKENNDDMTPVAVRSSAAGEDSRKKAFAGLQDTYLNMVGADRVVEAYHRDCASAYNLRSMTYRREAILDALAKAEESGDESIAETAKKEWSIENTSLSVCMMQMINPVVSGTAFSADTATGCRGTSRNDLVSIDASYGLGEAVVGGKVTPDKLYVFQRDDGSEVVIRQMGCKSMKIVYDEKGGTKEVPVPPLEALRWSLSLSQAESVARGVRAVSKAYGGMIMDTEFCLDANDTLWFVQARPETRWNEDFELHPTTIFMRRREVDVRAAEKAELIVEGNGASRGAGQGIVRFLRSALELNKISKGDVLTAERTDPDMVPGMRVASAIMADVGGDTSHAAITSRELGIAAVIGIQRLDVLRALDGAEVTVDGTSGRIYRGLLPLHQVGDEMEVAKLPLTKTKVGLVLADVGQALFLSRLRNYPQFEVGLLRAEFMLGNISIHPQALEAFDNGELAGVVQTKIKELEEHLSKVLREQMAAGLIVLDFNLREYVGEITGLSAEMTALANMEQKSAHHEDVLLQHRKMREIEHKIDQHLEAASRRMEVLKTSPDLEDHVRIIMGYDDELALLPAGDTEAAKRAAEIKASVAVHVQRIKDLPIIVELLRNIQRLREEVSLRAGLKKEMDDVRNLPDKICAVIKSRGFRTGKEHYVQTLSQNLALFAMAFYGKPITYRTTDFKSNEYRNLLGGNLFEHHEDNPMLGYRGVARNIHDWEIEAFKLARGMYGGTNLRLMLPFVRTLEEARSMRAYLEQVHKLKSGQDDLKIVLMSELPSNAILAKQFLAEFDGFSIGSNDMTQMVLAADRDNARLARIYDEEDPAVIWAILVNIFAGQKYGKKIGFCGQGVSNSLILRGLVAIAGITSASVVPDTYYQTVFDIAAVEAENIPTSHLGNWLVQQHHKNLALLMEKAGYGHILKKYTEPQDIQEWYEGELLRRHEQLREHLDTPKEAFYRAELQNFRSTFHKPVIYATWHWDNTVLDALHQAGFSTFEEQAKALETSRESNT